MGVSDRHYFAWLRGALERFESGSGLLAEIREHESAPVLWVLAGARPNPAVDFVRDALGSSSSVSFLDRFATDPGVVRADFNALGVLPAEACDVLMMTRASYMVRDPRAFLGGARRVLRSGGLMIVDWVHGSADAPTLDLAGFHKYAGERTRFRTTYADPAFLAEFPDEFGAFIRHVNWPPWWVNPERPGTRVGVGRAVSRLLGREPSRDVTLPGYLDALRADVGRVGGNVVEPALMEEFFKVVFREARYFHPLSKKFHLYLLTVLRPVGT